MSNISMLDIKTPAEVCTEIARREKAYRRGIGMTQAELARRSGVSLGSIRRFEQTGEVSLHALARMAAALGCDADLDGLFGKRAFRTIQEVIDAQDE